MPTYAVIFDMDGVITLTEAPHWESWQVVARKRGVTLEHKTFLSCFGRTNADCVPILFPGVSHAESLQIADDKEEAFRDIIRHNVPLAPGIVELFQELTSAGVKLAVGSSAPPENVNLVLDAGNIRQFFSAVVTGADVKRGKPAPDVFLLGAERVGAAPKNTAVIEDAPPGIAAAVAAGMIAVGVTTTHTADQLKAVGAQHLLPDIQALRRGLLLGLVHNSQ